jgi:hypothetical protein
LNPRDFRNLSVTQTALELASGKPLLTLLLTRAVFGRSITGEMSGVQNTTCINLRERFGRRYKIGWDTAYDPKHRPKDKLDPWMMLILCQRGEIYPYGGDLLAVDIDGRPVTARRLAKPGLRLVQDGDNEKTFVFPVEQFAQVAKIVKPRRCRQVSDAEKRRLADLARRHGFQKSDLHRPKRLQRCGSVEKAPM